MDSKSSKVANREERRHLDLYSDCIGFELETNAQNQFGAVWRNVWAREFFQPRTVSTYGIILSIRTSLEWIVMTAITGEPGTN